MKNYISVLLGLIFPQHCINCNFKPCSSLLCERCNQQLEFIENYCAYCGAPLGDNNTCTFCKHGDFYFTRGRSLYKFNQIIQKSIHQLKYQENISVARFFAEKIRIYLSENPSFPQIDYLIPVPLHRIKKRERGYNQSERICHYLSKLTGIPQLKKLVIRRRFTLTQTKLNREQRRENVEGAFRFRESKISRKSNLLIIDDVFTTGATLNAISKLLKNRGFTGIYVLTIARA